MLCILVFALVSTPKRIDDMSLQEPSLVPSNPCLPSGKRVVARFELLSQRCVWHVPRLQLLDLFVAQIVVYT